MFRRPPIILFLFFLINTFKELLGKLARGSFEGLIFFFHFNASVIWGRLLFLQGLLGLANVRVSF